MRHFNIPIFIPELACPHRCVFCNQNRISGVDKVPAPSDVSSIVDRYLATIPEENRVINIAFFGGSFTGIAIELQEAYLKAAHQYVQEKKIDGIRLSTRPDYINESIIALLKKYGVTCIELGAQSFNEEVLQKSGRGHNVDDTIKASHLIKSAGIELGLQMMLGLPGDTLERTVHTAKKIIACNADNTRIYPTLVIKDTPMQKMFEKGEYQPLGLDEAVDWAAKVYLLFENSGVTVLRTGLHPSEDIMPGESLLAGPYHISFKELVLAKIWRNNFETQLPQTKGKLKIFVSPDHINFAIGHQSCNRNWLKEKYGWIQIKPKKSLKGYEFEACYC